MPRVATGLVTAVLPAAQVIDHALAQARKLARMPASALRVTKRLLKQGLVERTLERMRDEAVELRAMLGSPEAREAFSAFLEKRKPDFSKYS